MSALLHAVRRTIQRFDLLPPGSAVVVALSGGSDSVALTHLLRELGRHGDFQVVGLAHLHHQLRTSADRDQQFCQALAERVGLPLLTERADVAGYAAAQRLSREEAARRLRYDFLRRAAATLNASHVAVGHTEDDQAETFLLKLMRGAGATGMAAIFPRRDAIVRPLLGVSREALRVYLRERGERWVEDETNADLGNPRNRVRHRVLPEMDAAYGGPVRPALARAAGLMRDDAVYLDALADEAWDQLWQPGSGGGTLDRERLASQPEPVRRRLVLRALREVAAGREIGFDHVVTALEVAAGRVARADLPGCRAEPNGGKLVLVQQDVHSK